jgi:ParB/RepB/Spo0J family partition protein
MAKYRLQEISPREVRFSNQNPRGESPEEIQNDKTFEQLKDSVAQFGVLVPIVVHEAKAEGGKKYILVDGERRLRAALATNRDEIPAHIGTSEDKMGELVQAFHIHMLRKQWKPVAIALAFKRIKMELKKKEKWKSDKELLRELQARTGCTKKQLEDLQRAVHYGAQVLRDVHAQKLLWSHLVQFEASFVEQLDQHYPGLLKKLGEREVRRVLVEKAQQKVIETTRDLIDYVVPVVQRAKTTEEKKLAEALLEKFITDRDMSPEVVKLAYDRAFPPPKDQLELAKEIIKNCGLLSPMIEQVVGAQIISFSKEAKELRKTMDALKITLGKKVRQLTDVMG